jgi:hypothetical protein
VKGDLLAGAANQLPGSNYFAYFAQGKQLNYVDDDGNRVSLKLSGAGYLEQVRDATGEGVLLDLFGAVPKHSTLSGSVHAAPARAVQPARAARKIARTGGQTNLGQIQGLGSFGSVKVLLKSPPFYLTQYPFQKNGRGVF